MANTLIASLPARSSQFCLLAFSRWFAFSYVIIHMYATLHRFRYRLYRIYNGVKKAASVLVPHWRSDFRSTLSFEGIIQKFMD